MLQLVEPFIHPWTVVQGLDNHLEVAFMFAKLSLERAEHFLDNPDELENWMQVEDQKLVLARTPTWNRAPPNIPRPAPAVNLRPAVVYKPRRARTD